MMEYILRNRSTSPQTLAQKFGPTDPLLVRAVGVCWDVWRQPSRLPLLPRGNPTCLRPSLRVGVRLK